MMTRTSVHLDNTIVTPPRSETPPPATELPSPSTTFHPTPFGKMDADGNIYPVTPTSGRSSQPESRSAGNSSNGHGNTTSGSTKGRRSRSVPSHGEVADGSQKNLASLAIPASPQDSGRSSVVKSRSSSRCRGSSRDSSDGRGGGRNSSDARGGRGEYRRRNGDQFTQERFGIFPRCAPDTRSIREQAQDYINNVNRFQSNVCPPQRSPHGSEHVAPPFDNNQMYNRHGFRENHIRNRENHHGSRDHLGNRDHRGRRGDNHGYRQDHRAPLSSFNQQQTSRRERPNRYDRQHIEESSQRAESRVEYRDSRAGRGYVKYNGRKPRDRYTKPKPWVNDYTEESNNRPESFLQYNNQMHDYTVLLNDDEISNRAPDFTAEPNNRVHPNNRVDEYNNARNVVNPVVINGCDVYDNLDSHSRGRSTVRNSISKEPRSTAQRSVPRANCDANLPRSRSPRTRSLSTDSKQIVKLMSDVSVSDPAAIPAVIPDEKFDSIVSEFSINLRRELSAEMIKAEQLAIPMKFGLDFLNRPESMSSSSSLNPRATEFCPVTKDAATVNSVTEPVVSEPTASEPASADTEKSSRSRNNTSDERISEIPKTDKRNPGTNSDERTRGNNTRNDRTMPNPGNVRNDRKNKNEERISGNNRRDERKNMMEEKISGKIRDERRMQEETAARVLLHQNTASLVDLSHLTNYPPPEVSNIDHLMYGHHAAPQDSRSANQLPPSIFQNAAGQVFISTNTPPPSLSYCHHSQNYPNIHIFNPNGFQSFQNASQLNSQLSHPMPPEFVAAFPQQVPHQNAYSVAELYQPPPDANAVIYGTPITPNMTPNLTPNLTPNMTPNLTPNLTPNVTSIQSMTPLMTPLSMTPNMTPVQIYDGQQFTFPGGLPSAPAQPVMARMEMPPRQVQTDPRDPRAMTSDTRGVTVSSSQFLHPPPVFNFQAYCLTTDNEHPVLYKEVQMPDAQPEPQRKPSVERKKPTLMDRVGETLKEVRESLKKNRKSETQSVWEEIILKLLKAPSSFAEPKELRSLYKAIELHVKEARADSMMQLTDSDLFQEIFELTWPIVSLDVNSSSLNHSLLNIVYNKNISSSNDPAKDARINRSRRNFLKAWCELTIEGYNQQQNRNSGKSLNNANQNQRAIENNRQNDQAQQSHNQVHKSYHKAESHNLTHQSHDQQIYQTHIQSHHTHNQQSQPYNQAAHQSHDQSQFHEKTYSTNTQGEVDSVSSCDVMHSLDDVTEISEDSDVTREQNDSRRESLRGVSVGTRISYFESNAKSDEASKRLPSKK